MKWHLQYIKCLKKFPLGHIKEEYSILQHFQRFSFFVIFVIIKHNPSVLSSTRSQLKYLYIFAQEAQAGHICHVLHR